MSGGKFDYSNDKAAREIFNWGADVDYGMGDSNYQRNVKSARKINPLEDKQLSELVFDVFCLLHSFDWYASGDTGGETYFSDVEY